MPSSRPASARSSGGSSRQSEPQASARSLPKQEQQQQQEVAAREGATAVEQEAEQEEPLPSAQPSRWELEEAEATPELPSAQQPATVPHLAAPAASPRAAATVKARPKPAFQGVLHGLFDYSSSSEGEEEQQQLRAQDHSSAAAPQAMPPGPNAGPSAVAAEPAVLAAGPKLAQGWHEVAAPPADLGSWAAAKQLLWQGTVESSFSGAAEATGSWFVPAAEAAGAAELKTKLSSALPGGCRCGGMCRVMRRAPHASVSICSSAPLDMIMGVAMHNSCTPLGWGRLGWATS